MDLGVRSSHHGSGFTRTKTGLRGVRALVLVGGKPGVERFGETPLALLDVLGRSVLLRTLDRLRDAGVEEIAVLSDADALPTHSSPASCKFSVASPEQFWEEALHQFRKLSRRSESVLMLRLGAWVEVDFATMIEEHRRIGTSIMRACSRFGEAADVFVLSSNSQAEAAALLRGELCDERIPVAAYITDGYMKALDTPSALRNLVLDAFAGDAELRPQGRELRPGVWLAKGARVHRHARIVAPAFIGSYCNVHRDAVVTRGSSIEHHSEVDCATVIENSSVLPHTRVGAGLDVEYSIVGLRQVHSIQRNVTVCIDDPRLIGTTASHLASRVIAVGSWIVHCLPDTLWHLLSAEPAAEPSSEAGTKVLGSAPSVIGDSSMAPVESQTKSYREMAARRYGNE